MTVLQIRPDNNTSQFAANVAATATTYQPAAPFNQTSATARTPSRHVINIPSPATRPDGDTLTYSATGLPGGISINPATGLISGTINYDSAGTHSTPSA